MQSFTKKLKAFCKLCPWVDCLNPPELCNSGGRIQRAVQVTPELRKTKDMLFVRSMPLNETTEQATEQQLQFGDSDDERPF